MRRQRLQASSQQGFTLVELVMVIVILGIISSMVAVFMRGPIDAYFAAARRAALTDAADTVLRRLERDVRKSLPNSLRTPSAQCLELIPTKAGGRYRADGSAAALTFDAPDSSFNMLGLNSALPLSQQMVAGDVIVVYNLGASVPQSDTYLNVNTATVQSVGPESGGETTITFTAPKQFPLESGGNRFHVVPAAERVVSYVCNNSDNTLRRTVNSANFTSSCPATGPVIATNVSCNFDYSGDDLARNALVRIVLQITGSNNAESVQLQQEIHINNTP
jgi:MSHA biogenesis protein MshO